MEILNMPSHLHLAPSCFPHPLPTCGRLRPSSLELWLLQELRLWAKWREIIDVGCPISQSLFQYSIYKTPCPQHSSLTELYNGKSGDFGVRKAWTRMLARPWISSTIWGKSFPFSETSFPHFQDELDELLTHGYGKDQTWSHWHSAWQTVGA